MGKMRVGQNGRKKIRKKKMTGKKESGGAQQLIKKKMHNNTQRNYKKDQRHIEINRKHQHKKYNNIIKDK